MNFLLSLGTRIRSGNPHHHAIFKGMVSITLFVMLGKLISAAKEMAVAYRYGLGAEVDAYQFVFNLVAWPIGIWCSVLTAVLVPLAVRIREFDELELPRFRSELLGLAVLLGVGLGMLAWIGIATMLHMGWSGLPAVTVRLAQEALPGLILLLPLGILVGLQSTWMLSASRHVNTLLDSVPTLFICAAVLGVAGGIDALVWGTVVGTAVQLVTLLIPMARRGEIEPPRLTHASPQWHWFWQGFGIMLAGQAMMSLTVIVDQFYAVGLGTGAIATLGYANRILSLILGLSAMAVSRATLPVFSQSRLDSTGRMYSVAAYWTRLMFAAGLGATVICYWGAPLAVRLLFERGAFSASDTRIVADVLRYGIPQLPFYFSSMVLVSYALSQRRYTLIFWSGVIGLFFKSIANAVLVPHFGINGIAAASVLMAAFISAFFWLTLGRSNARADKN